MLASLLTFSLLSFAQVNTGSEAAIQASKEAQTAEATLDVEWEKVEDAEAYEVQLTPSTGGPPFRFTSTTTKLNQKLPQGIYKLQIRSKEKSSGYFGPWSSETEVEVVPKAVQLISPKEGAEIAEPKEKRSQVQFEWSPIRGAKEYTLRIWFDDERNAKEFKSATNKKTLSLPTAKAYAWQVTFLTDKAIGYLATPQIGNFTVLGKQLLKPVFVGKQKWKQSPSAKTYEVKFFTKALDEEQWTLIKSIPSATATELVTEKLAPADYKIEVIAKAPNRVSSEAAVSQFTIKPTEAELANAMKKAL